MKQAAGSLSLFPGLGFGLPCVFAIRHFEQTGEVWTFMGFPTYGNGPFERIGVQTSTALLVGFLIVCIAEVAVGVMLWTGTPYASAASCGLLPLEFAFWIGFAPAARTATGDSTRCSAAIGLTSVSKRRCTALSRRKDASRIAARGTSLRYWPRR